MVPLLGIKKKVPIKQMHIYKEKKEKEGKKQMSLISKRRAFIFTQL